ncbi:hypothetical protein (plasmid) [Vibrio vulnificus YJ016]|uniref:Uncharacterized protein n=1 Tax=Vibrio vulnificus (strain YJ016) TaxID=196600 RepID=Q7MBM6_VIBVY|nr:hypothetical protein [Vibrio vulnificus YJ016]
MVMPYGSTGKCFEKRRLGRIGFAWQRARCQRIAKNSAKGYEETA